MFTYFPFKLFKLNVSILLKQAEEDAMRKQISYNPDDNKASDTIRQRIPTTTTNVIEEEEPMVTDIILEASIQRTNK